MFGPRCNGGLQHGTHSLLRKGQKIGGQGVEFAQVFVPRPAFIAALIKQRRGKRCDIWYVKVILHKSFLLLQPTPNKEYWIGCLSSDLRCGLDEQCSLSTQYASPFRNQFKSLGCIIVSSFLSNPGDPCTHHFRSFIREVSGGKVQITFLILVRRPCLQRHKTFRLVAFCVLFWNCPKSY